MTIMEILRNSSLSGPLTGLQHSEGQLRAKRQAPVSPVRSEKKVSVCIQDPSATVGERHERDCANGEFSVADR